MKLNMLVAAIAPIIHFFHNINTSPYKIKINIRTESQNSGVNIKNSR